METYTAVAALCRTVASISTSYDTNNTGVTARYLPSVSSGSTFQLELTADPMTIPTQGGGYPIQHLRQVRVRFAVPAGTSFVSATLSGGSNLGSGTPTVTESGGIVTLLVPGNLTPGTVATLPTVTLTLTATAAPGSTIDARLYGNSYDNWSIAFIAKVKVGFLSIDGNAQCYDPANPQLAAINVT